MPVSSRLLFLFIVIALLGACLGPEFVIDKPQPSSALLSNSDGHALVFGIEDRRSQAERQFHRGLYSDPIANVPNEIRYFANELERELISRALGVVYDWSGTAPTKLLVNRFYIRSAQLGPDKAFYTYTVFSADLVHQNRTTRIGFYFQCADGTNQAVYRRREACYSQPMSLLIKEVASKLNRARFGFSSSTTIANALVKEANNIANPLAYTQVLALGYTNNPVVIPELVQLTNHPDAMIRASAISALGAAGAQSYFGLLKGLYHSRQGRERLMAIKAVGDLGGRPAQHFLRMIKASPAYQDVAVREVVDVYL